MPEEIRELAEEEFRQHGTNIDKSKFVKYFNDKSSRVNIEWLGSNKDAKVYAQNKTSEYFTYSLIKKDKSIPVKAEAYKKLIYQNIYHNIDVEFVFPKNNKGGIKYNVIVHPGGDLSQVKMKYSGHQRMLIDQEGNLKVNTLSSPFTDHAPIAFYELEAEKNIRINFQIQGDVVSFQCDSYDRTRTLIVDPWVTNPAFAGPYNAGYGIRADYFGNCYVYGGGVSTGGIPANYTYQVKKINPAGNIQWTYTTPPLTYGFYGDIAVDRAGNSFIGAGFGFSGGNFILKLDNAGVQTAATNAGIPGTGTDAFEPWKLSYNQATNSGFLYVGGGCTKGFQLGKISTNLTGMQGANSFNSTNALKDVVYIAQEKDESYIYAVVAANNLDPNGVGPHPEDQTLVRVPTATMAPYSYQVKSNPDFAGFSEAGQSDFINGGIPSPAGTSFSTGLNGMKVSDAYLYTHNGAVLTAWNKSAGTVAYTVNSGGAFDKYSGIDADSCGGVYIGVKDVVKRYSPTLALETFFPAGGDVYDLQLDPIDNKRLYVAGKGFVQMIDVSKCTSSNLAAIGTTATICANSGGCATLSASPNGGTTPYTYSWNTGATTQSITVCPSVTTNYTVTVTDSTGKIARAIATASLTVPPATITGPGSICQGTSATLSAPSGTNYSWSTGETTSSIVVSPTSMTAYSVTLAIGGCPTYASRVLSVGNIPAPISGPSVICPGSSITLSTMATGTYSWSTGATTSSITAVPTNTTNYSITVTNGSCKAVGSMWVTMDVPTATVTPSSTVICPGSSVTLSASGGTSYSWNSGETTYMIVVFPTDTTTYCATVTNANNCSKNVCTTIYSCQTSIQPYDIDKSVSVFPNPSKGIFTVYSDRLKINSIQIFNVLGEKIAGKLSTKTDRGNPPGYSILVDLAHEPSGIYVLRIHTDQGSLEKKISIDR